MTKNEARRMEVELPAMQRRLASGGSGKTPEEAEEQAATKATMRLDDEAVVLSKQQ